MTTPAAKPGPVEAEAASWFAQLNTTTVSAETMAAFRLWRQQPGHREAFQAVERMWGKTAVLMADDEIQGVFDQAVSRGDARLGATGISTWGLRALAATVVVLGAAGVVVFAASRGEFGPVFSTGIGEQRLVRLEDGSTVRLDTDSQIKVRYSRGRRDLVLRKGQALFEVAHDRSRPFVVASGDTLVRAVGTRFDVRQDAGATQVTLLEGKVEVRGKAGDAPVYLTPGLQVRSGAGLGPVRKVDVETATSWTSGRIVFHETPLAEAIAEINRYSPTLVRLDPAYDGKAPLSGAFESADTRAIVDAISTLRGLEVRAQPDGSLLLTPARSVSQERVD